MKVDLPKRGGFTFVRKMSCGELLEFFSSDATDGGKEKVLTVLARCLCSSSGDFLFGDDPDPKARMVHSLEQDDVAALKDKFMEINGLATLAASDGGKEKKD